MFAAKYPNVFRRPYGTLVEGKRSTIIPMSGIGLENKGGNPEYPIQQEYGSIANGVGENPLNGNSITLT